MKGEEAIPMRDIQGVINTMIQMYPETRVQQLKVQHPGADDDGLWFFQQPGCKYEVQVESSTGMCPFLIETDENEQRLTGSTVAETVEILAKLLHLRSD